jgi:high-affinity iron transporter
MKHCSIALLVFYLLSWVSVTIAQERQPTPPQAAELLRQHLFDAQIALMSDKQDDALMRLAEARELYLADLQAQLAASAPEINQRLTEQWAAAEQHIRGGEKAAFAALRSQVWTNLLAASSQIIYTAITQQDSATAALWLPLRDFRVSTRFSRPGADATLAVSQLAEGTVQPEFALDAVRTDLLDTYQAQLAVSLRDADEAQQNGFGLRGAEEAGLAAGYFALLSDSFREQRGQTAESALTAAFATLVEAGISGNSTLYAQTRALIDAALDGFRAAPLSMTEQMRRAGQLLRFIALVPIEYERGVRDGVVTNDIEVQEAITFHTGATAAFNDLQSVLSERDSKATARVNELLAAGLHQIREVAEPAALRSTTDEIGRLLSQTMPVEWQDANADSDIDVILSVLDQVRSAAGQGEYQLAESARLEAYALLELGLEQRLRGFAPEMAARIESLFWQGDGVYAGLATLLTTQADSVEIRVTLSQLERSLDEAHQLIESARSAPAAVAGNAAVIVFREGLEAVIILASLLASLRTAEERLYRRPLIAGSALALLASAVTWWVANGLLTVMLPLGEKLEAIVSLIAIAVLLLITNWFFHKVYWTGWMANFHARKRALIGGVITISIGQTVGLVILGFTSIYREGFETVLFLQSLVLEAGISIVLQGVLLGMLGVVIVGVLTFVLQTHLPYKKMLVVTGVLIGGVLLVMVGNTVHVMQSVGWLPITPVRGLFVPYWMGQWFGLFANWEGLGLQILAAVFVVGSYFLAEYQNKRKRIARIGAGEARPATV